MKMRLVFEGEQAEVVLIAEDDFEKRALGVIAGGEQRVCEASVTCEARAHYSYGTVDKATIRLKRSADKASVA